jgi:hypothetical protein
MIIFWLAKSLHLQDVLMLAGKNQISYASRHLSYLELDVKVSYISCFSHLARKLMKVSSI